MNLSLAIQTIIDCDKAGLNVMAVPRGSKDCGYGICLNKSKTGVVCFDKNDNQNHALPTREIDWVIVKIPLPEIKKEFIGHNEDRRYQSEIENWLVEQFKKLDLGWDSGIEIDIRIRTVRRDR